MAHVLHQAILDAIRHTPEYDARSVLVTPALEATRVPEGQADVLYQSVYTIMSAMPARLARGSRFQVTTLDLDDGIQLSWEAREEPTLVSSAKDIHGLLAFGPHGDLVGIALRALERFCHLRAGHLESRFQEVRNSSSFAQPSYIVRRVVAYIPWRPSGEPGRQAAKEPEAPAAHDEEGTPGGGSQATLLGGPMSRRRVRRVCVLPMTGPRR